LSTQADYCTTYLSTWTEWGIAFSCEETSKNAHFFDFPDFLCQLKYMHFSKCYASYQAAEKLAADAEGSPQALKRGWLEGLNGTTEVVPFPNPDPNRSVSAAC
jgi:hypothetical protein